MAELERTAVLNIDTGGAQVTIKDLVAQMKELKNQMANVEEGSKEFYELANAAGEVKHQIDEINASVRAGSSDFGDLLSNATKSFAGVLGSVQAVKGAMTLLGVESDNVGKAIQKMQASMAIIQGIQAIDNGTKAFKRLLVAIKAATVGINGMKKALISSGIGIAVLAIGALAANWDTLTGKVNEEAEAERKRNQEKLNRELKTYNDELERSIKLREKVSGIMGSSDLETAQETLNIYSKAYNILRQFQETGGGDARLFGDDWVKETNPELYQQILNNAAAASKELTELMGVPIKITSENLQQLVNQYAQLLIEQDKHVKELKVIDAAETEAEKKRKAADAAKKRAEENRKALEALKKSYQELTIEIGNYNKTAQELDIDKLNKAEEENIKIIEEAHNRKLMTDEVYEQQVLAIHEHYTKERLRVDKEYADERAKTEQDKIKDRVEAELAELVECYEFAMLEIDTKQKELSAKLSSGMIGDEEYDEGIAALDKKRLELYIQNCEEQLEVEGLTAEQILDIKRNLVSAQIQLDEMAAASAKQASDKVKRTWSNGISMAGAFAGAITQTLDAVGDMMEEGSAEQKAIQTTSAVISTLVGIMQAIQGGNAMAAQMGLAAPVGWALGALQAAATLATGIATIAQINSANDKTNLGGASAAVSGAATNATLIAPTQYTQAVEGAELETTISDTRVYVVESDITDTQDRVRVSENEATF